MNSDTLQTLDGLKKEKPALVGIDSDGCVFDTMTVKQVSCFHPVMIRIWNLEPIEAEARETAEFVNLYSRWRGSNRFPALCLTFDLLAQRPEPEAKGVALPDLSALKAFIASGRPLSQDALAEEVERNPDPELQRVLAWSRAANAAIERTVTDVPPFPGVREALEAMRAESELIVVSQTPVEALVREWKAQDLIGFVSVIAGQEQGSKCEHLVQASTGRWEMDSVLLLGDAPGDWKAAREAGACFFPIEVGSEAESWSRLTAEAYPLFRAGRYRGAYEGARIESFLARLPEQPPWET